MTKDTRSSSARPRLGRREGGVPRRLAGPRQARGPRFLTFSAPGLAWPRSYPDFPLPCKRQYRVEAFKVVMRGEYFPERSGGHWRGRPCGPQRGALGPCCVRRSPPPGVSLLPAGRGLRGGRLPPARPVLGYRVGALGPKDDTPCCPLCPRTSAPLREHSSSPPGHPDALIRASWGPRGGGGGGAQSQLRGFWRIKSEALNGFTAVQPQRGDQCPSLVGWVCFLLGPVCFIHI